jgi:hypothetical protein
MSRRDLVTDLEETTGVPAWKAIEGLGYKPELFLASEDKERGVVLLAIPNRPGLMGIAWWSGPDWQDPTRLRAQIKWSRSPLALLSWATLHPVVSAFKMLTHWLNVKVQQTAN